MTANARKGLPGFCAASICATLLGLPGIVLSQEVPLGDADDDSLDEITIVGSSSDLSRTAGSASVIDSETLEQFKYTDVQRIVRQVPGVSVQVEDGYGLRPRSRAARSPAVLAEVCNSLHSPKSKTTCREYSNGVPPHLPRQRREFN